MTTAADSATKPLALFLPLTKVDVAQRLVYGKATDESPDRSGEICDYASSKPYFEAWSGEIAKNTNGKSYGNVRAMHGKTAAGKLTAINFNDAEKAIEVCAKVVDAAEWEKVLEGVYTGFSQGGKYVKRWPDKDNPGLTRFTAEPMEISLVDLPCLPTATFSIIKAAGVVEEKHFVNVVAEPVVEAPLVAKVEGDPEIEPEQAEVTGELIALAKANPEGPKLRQFWECGCKGADHEHKTLKAANACMRKRKAEEAVKAAAAPVSEALDALAALAAGEKAADPFPLHWSADTIDEAAKVAGDDEAAKRAFNTDERRKAAANGSAMPDGCLSGDTLVETVSGPIPIANLIGPCKVLTDLGWRDADIRCFGIQRLVEIDFQRGQDRRVILATLGHRWYSERGVVLTGDLVAGDAVPHVSRDAFDAEGFDPSEHRIAASAEQSAHSASSVVVIDKERRPEPTARSMGALSYGLLAADRAAAVLSGNHTIEVVVGDIVLAPQITVAARQPARVADLDFGAGFAGVGALAKLAFRSEATAAPIEVGSRALDFAETANEAHRGFMDQWGNRLHIPHNIEPWRVNQVRLTDLVEPVFCAVVPGAHRFALAGGLLTGNSFPIENKQDLENAIQAVGRAKDPMAAKKHIMARAKALGCPECVPDDWTKKMAAKEAALADLAKYTGEECDDSARAVSILSSLHDLLANEGDESDQGGDQAEQAGHIRSAIGHVKEFVASEIKENHDDADPVKPMEMALGRLADLAKAGRRNSAADQARLQKCHDLMKEMGAECGSTASKAAEANAEALEKALAENAAFREEIAKIAPAVLSLTAEVAKFRTAPAPARAAVNALGTTQGGSAINSQNVGAVALELLGKMSPEERTAVLMKDALAHPMPYGR